ncbi:HNH endonuclease [Rheinheimera sp.]|uniref:HNH endonuclease n=1 Tax=Rheinheimera sp. TaxID=1869214 RepID=UPI00307D6A65
MLALANKSKGWSREQLLVAYSLYTRLRFGQFDQRNAEVIAFAALIGRSPSALAMKLGNIASLDPVITSSGRSGLTGASAADRAMWQELQDDWSAFSLQMAQTVAVLQPQSEPLVWPEVHDFPVPNYSSTTKESVVQVRIGQAYFRNAVLSAYNNRCCITGLTVPKLLIASHIVPWSEDVKHRLNPQNGLALSALHDKAFDLGMLTIDEQYRVVVSAKLKLHRDEFFQAAIQSVHGKKMFMPEKFSPNTEFLALHRDTIFEKRF